jgi:hypothetical protein
LSDWTIEIPARLNAEFAEQLSPGERRAVYLRLQALAADPRTNTVPEPVTGAELRRTLTEPAADTGARVTILYRVTDETRVVAVIWLLTGP